MAPKAAAAGKADAKGKAKPKKTEKKEEEAPRREAPDQAAFDAKLEEIQKKIDKLQEEQKAISKEISGKNEGKDEFFSEKGKILAELTEVKAQLEALHGTKQKISGQLDGQKAENQSAKDDLRKMQKSMRYSNGEDIDKRIREIENTMAHSSLSLKAEKDYMKEITELKQSKKKVAQFADMSDKVSNMPGLSGDMVAQKKEIQAQIALLMEKKKEINGKLDALNEERKAKQGDPSDLFEKRNQKGEKIKELIAERNQARDDFRKEKEAFREYLAEQRRLKQERYAAEKEEWAKQAKIRQLEAKVAQLDEQPHVQELTLLEQTIKFCKDLLPQSADQSKEEKKETTYNNKDNETVLLKKEDRDEEFFFAATKTKKGKKGPKTEAEQSKKPIKHNAETFKLFHSLKLDAPVTVADIPALLTKLEEQKAGYEKKVEEWSKNKEEMKQKIRDGIVSIEDLDAADKEKEAEKEAEKEEEKEEEKA